MISLVKIDYSTWKKHWSNIARAHLLQSWEYGLAKHNAQKWGVHRFLLQDHNAKPIGLMQVLSRSLPIIGGVARINRGPVFFSDSQWLNASEQFLTEVMQAIIRIAKRYRWWYLRIAPNFAANNGNAAVLEKLGFKKKGSSPSGSAWVSVDKTIDEVRSSLHGSWRRNLKKSEAMNFELEIPDQREGFSYLAVKYKQMQQEKEFRGNPENVLQEMIVHQSDGWDPVIMFIRYEQQRIAGILFVGSGDTFIYLVGWLSDTGRQLKANYFLFFNAMQHFRSLGYKFFDVGGFGALTTEGVGRFKRQLKGQEYFLVGEYSYSLLG